jgi:hypothetical protein
MRSDTMENIIKEIIENPNNYSIIIDVNSNVTAYNKTNGDSHNFNRSPLSILIDLLWGLGVETEHL